MAPQHDLTRYSVAAAFAEDLNGGLAFIYCHILGRVCTFDQAGRLLCRVGKQGDVNAHGH